MTVRPLAERMHGPQGLARGLNGLASAFPSDPNALNPDVLVARTTKVIGLAPPPEGRFRAPLKVLTDAAAASNLNALGRRSLAGALTMRLGNHFAIEDHLARHPEVLDEPIERPVFIVSLPRTGTTMLHRLLSVLEGHRAPFAWEMDRPVGATGSGASLLARTASNLRIGLLHQLCPDLRRIHDIRPHYPEECTHLLANDLTSMLFSVFYDLPGYRAYLNQLDFESAYRSHRRQLQLAQHGRPRKRWVLKAPFHLLGLDALLRVYPDALIVQTHRDPTSVVPSLASLYLSVRRAFHTASDAHALGTSCLDDLGLWLDRAMAAREDRPTEQFLDIHYQDAVREPIEWVERIVERLGGSLDEADRMALKGQASAHRQHKHGRHRYSLEAFGLTASQVRHRFRPYLDVLFGLHPTQRHLLDEQCDEGLERGGSNLQPHR